MASRLTITIAGWVSSGEAEFIKEFAQTFGMTYKESGGGRSFTIVVDPAQLDAWNKHLAVWKEDGSVVCSVSGRGDR
jgi:signal recognition particle receptor subunit beta